MESEGLSAANRGRATTMKRTANRWDRVDIAGFSNHQPRIDTDQTRIKTKKRERNMFSSVFHLCLSVATPSSTKTYFFLNSADSSRSKYRSLLLAVLRTRAA